MKKYFSVVAGGLYLFLLAGQAFTATIDDITVTATDTTVVVSIVTDALTSQDVKVPPPVRIVLDFANTEYRAEKPKIEINMGSLIAVRSGQFETDIARVVLDLESETEYIIEKTDRGFDIILEAVATTDIEIEVKEQEVKEQEVITEKPEESEVFSYSTRGRRDPFKPLVGLPSEEDTLLDVRNAQVVGIVWSPQEKYALIQAVDGEVYILEEGDRVRYGKVYKVYKKSVEFTLWELGRTERLALRIKEKE